MIIGGLYLASHDRSKQYDAPKQVITSRQQFINLIECTPSITKFGWNIYTDMIIAYSPALCAQMIIADPFALDYIRGIAFKHAKLEQRGLSEIPCPDIQEAILEALEP